MSKLESLKRDLDALNERYDAKERTRRELEMAKTVRENLKANGVADPKRLKLATAYLLSQSKVTHDGSEISFTSDDGETTVAEGIKAWLASEDAEVYREAKTPA